MGATITDVGEHLMKMSPDLQRLNDIVSRVQ